MKNKKFKNKKIVHIFWRDSYGVSAVWETLDGIKPVAVICESIGYLTFNDDEHVVIVPHYHPAVGGNGAGGGCGDMTIPRSAIIEMRELKAKK